MLAGCIVFGPLAIVAEHKLDPFIMPAGSVEAPHTEHTIDIRPVGGYIAVLTTDNTVTGKVFAGR
jgi:hypothetical protein